MKRLILLALFISVFSFGQNDSIKVDVSKISKKDYKGIKKTYDKFDNVTVFSLSMAGTSHHFLPEIKVVDSVMSFRIIAKSNSYNWIFYDKITLSINGNKFDFNIPITNEVINGSSTVKNGIIKMLALYDRLKG